MKVTVTRACGHEEVVEVFGTNAERERKIAWYESTVCGDCYYSEGYEEVTMSYAEYKNNYSDCKTKKNSYDKATKTIVVYIKKEEPEVVEEVKDVVAEVSEEEAVNAVAEIMDVPAPHAQALIKQIDDAKKMLDDATNGKITIDNAKYDMLKRFVEYIDSHKII